jgi:release factor glutamine methyltransferase
VIINNVKLTTKNKVAHRADNLLQMHRRHLNPYLVKLKHLTLLMQPNVFCAAYGDGSRLLATVLMEEVRSDDTVLDMGTGSGAMAIIAAKRCKNNVVATDISPVAVKCAANNTAINGVVNQVNVREGNLFEVVEPDEKFSLIIFNPPFMDGEPRDLLEMAMYDRDYKTLRQFFQEFPRYIKPDGRLLLVFSEAGNLNILENLIQESGFKFEIVSSDLPREYDLKVLVYKLCQGST